MIEKKYRIRNKSKIVGYSNKASVSTNTLSWDLGVPYDGVDAFVGLLDKNNRPIYEQDIVGFRLAKKGERQKEGIVLWDEVSCAFGVLELETSGFIPLEAFGFPMFFKSKLEVISHGFTHGLWIDKLVREYYNV
ncbi:MAG: hypothetical protein C4K58_03140 [Flavobacteriaceae bacterium]|nr:MAG: hypothetical protein C4K58_03140 [Flavobacteriaceae bacterium]